MVHKLLSVGVIFLCMHPSRLVGQDQKIADSVKLIYQQDTIDEDAKLALLKELSFNEIRDLKKALLYADELIDLAEKKGDKDYVQEGYFITGNKEMLLTNIKEALSAFLKSAELAKELNSLTKEGECYIAIADIYSSANNHNTSVIYYSKAI